MAVVFPPLTFRLSYNPPSRPPRRPATPAADGQGRGGGALRLGRGWRSCRALPARRGTRAAAATRRSPVGRPGSAVDPHRGSDLVITTGFRSKPPPRQLFFNTRESPADLP